MTILDRISADWKAARIAAGKAEPGAAAKALTLGVLIGEVQTKSKRSDASRAWTDADTMALVKAGIENGKVTAEALRTSGNRPDDLAKVEAEIATLSAYMPTQMTETEIEAFILAKAASGVGKMGDLMAALKAERSGQYDGKVASIVAKRVLG